MKCIFCGADAKSAGGNSFRCPYCGGTFEGEKPREIEQPRAEVKPAVPEIPKETVIEKKEVQKPEVEPQPNPQPTVAAPRSKDGTSVFEDNVNAVLEITWNPTRNTQTSGSGFLISKNGYALTNAHVVTDDSGKITKEVNVRIAGASVKATVIRLGDDKRGAGSGVDLALIKLNCVPAGARAATLADFTKVRIGEQVFVIGNSLGDGTCITAGIVSDKERKVNGHTLLMTDCAINGGNSGGPIFNAMGDAIGVICSSRIKADGTATEGMNYAVPINIAIDFLNGKYSAVRVAGEDAHIDYTCQKSE